MRRNNGVCTCIIVLIQSKKVTVLYTLDKKNAHNKRKKVAIIPPNIFHLSKKELYKSLDLEKK